MLHKGYTKFIMPAGIMSSASINIIRSNPIISADLSGLSVIRSFIIRMNPVYDKTDGGLNGFHRSTSLVWNIIPQDFPLSQTSQQSEMSQNRLIINLFFHFFFKKSFSFFLLLPFSKWLILE